MTTDDAWTCFRPWIGRNWRRGGVGPLGVHVLVLGEAHWTDIERVGSGSCCPDFTSKIVQEYALDGPSRFFTGITQVLTGRRKWELSRVELSELWDSIIFYNYVTVFAAEGPNKAPTEKMFRDSAPAFAAILAELEPDAILVCGYRQWQYVTGDWNGPKRIDQGPIAQLGSVVAARIMHPSAHAFSSTRQRPIALAMLEAVRTRASPP